ncbi:AraC family transcriptional regulator (plasmid) [Paraburkholderia sp. PREW-6R]|uniref:AraC family transcriptional regulator n=1 Tax=Paraburkholderia sp. PREW-6R TaxID=3141544 RepID=UPI0031F48DD7
MKPAYEHVEFGENCSVRVYHRRLPRIPFEWHHHPEYELTLTLNSHGKRYIGDSITDYVDRDLVLVPPNLPHTWSSNRSIDAASPQVAIVIWFGGDWARRLADVCPEYAPLRNLLRRAASGLAFGPEAGAAMHMQIDDLLSGEPRKRLAAVLNVLCILGGASGEPLASPAAFSDRGEGPSGHEPERINRVLSMIDLRFAEPLRLSELCAAANVSERSLARYFEQHMGESVGRYISRVRIGHACRMLAHTSVPIAVVAARSGFPNVAHFNRQFKALKALTPMAYRKQFAAGDMAGMDADPLIDERSPSLQRKPGRVMPAV